jgi:hypothetical protein
MSDHTTNNELRDLPPATLEDAFVPQAAGPAIIMSNDDTNEAVIRGEANDRIIQLLSSNPQPCLDSTRRRQNRHVCLVFGTLIVLGLLGFFYHMFHL